MRKVLKKNIILYKPLFQVIIAGPVGGPILFHRNARGQILCFARNAGGQIL